MADFRYYPDPPSWSDITRRALDGRPDDLLALTPEREQALEDFVSDLSNDVSSLSSTAVSKNDFDAKGDLLVGTGDNTYDNLPAGSDGSVLVADSTTATGLKWGSTTTATDSIGAIGTAYERLLPGKVYAGPYIPATTSAQQTIAPGEVRLCYFAFRDYQNPSLLLPHTFDRIQTAVQANNASTGTFRFGIYNVDATTGLATTVARDFGTAAWNANNQTVVLTLGTPSALTPGKYLFGLYCSRTAGTGSPALSATTHVPANSFAAQTTGSVPVYYGTVIYAVSNGLSALPDLTGVAPTNYTPNILPLTMRCYA